MIGGRTSAARWCPPGRGWRRFQESHPVDQQGSQPTTGAVRVPGYDLLETIGEGGMGVVYRAMQQQPRRVVAIKFLTPVPSNQFSVAAFEREARMMASLHHPNVVTIHDCGQIDGRYYIVMEYVSGPP